MKQKKLIVAILIIVILAAVGITIALLTQPEAKNDAATSGTATVSETLPEGTSAEAPEVPVAEGTSAEAPAVPAVEGTPAEAPAEPAA